MAEYYILSTKWPPVGNCALWWGPDDKGYVCDVERAGRYTQEQVDADPDCYNNGEHTVAIPCDEVDAKAVKHVRWGELVEFRKKAKAYAVEAEEIVK